MLKLSVFIFLIGLLSFLQAFGFSIFDIKPNLALVGIIAASFFIANIYEGLLLTALAALILKFAPGFEKEILLFFLIGIGIIIIRNYLPWHNFLNVFILIISSTIIFYLIAPNLIFTMIFLKELIMNLFFGFLIFAFLNYLCQNR